MRVAVTGASGHIGSCLVNELKLRGVEIKVLVHNYKSNIDELNVEPVAGSLLDPESLIRLCEGVDVVFHLAAQIAIDNSSAQHVYETNVTGTKNMLKVAKDCKVRKFIHFSSIHAFQIITKDKLLDETTPRIESEKTIYEFTKAEGEREVIKAVENGLNAVILNPTAVIGPFDHRNSLLGQAIRKIYQNKLPFMISGGYNWVDVRDVVSAAINAIESGRSGENYILSGKFYSLHELAVLISQLSAGKIPLNVPVSLARLACPLFKFYSLLSGSQPLYTQQSLDILVNSPVNISNQKARNELEFEPRPLDQTIRDTIDWYKKNKFLN